MRNAKLVSAAIAMAGLVLAASPSHSQSNAAPASEQTWVPVKAIDFSSKHALLIKEFDGSLTPMDQPHFQSQLIAPGTWQILSEGDYMYLVEGDNEALMIDGGDGAGNIRQYAQSLTKKPLRYIANTHYHFDHTANDGYFDKAFMSEGTKANLPAPSASFAGIDFPRNYPIQVIPEGYKFQLGNRELEAIMLGNHTVGGTAYLDRKQRILFVGDEIMGQQGIALHVSVQQFEKLMEKLAAHRSEYDLLCAGWEMLDASWVDKYLALAKYILAGHDGIPASQAPPAPLPNGWRQNYPDNRDPEGRTVFLRHIPRNAAGPLPPGSVAGAGQAAAPGGAGSAPDTTLRMTYGGATITYDRNKVRD